MNKEMADIVISEFLDQEAIKRTAGDYSVHYDPDLVDKKEELKDWLTTAKALVVRNRTQVNQELIEAAPNLKVVGRLGVGLDNIDMEGCQQRGIKVCPATGANDAAVAEWVITSSLILLRGAFLKNSEMIAGKWPRQESMGNEISGKLLGLVGFGGIAKDTAKRAQYLGMATVAYDPYVKPADPCWQNTSRAETLDELLQKADVVSLHVPLNKETFHLFNSETISQMKNGAILINAARGGVVDEKALVSAMQSGRLAGAALDVFENEPLTQEGAELFRGLPNIILTPHIGGVTVESNQRVSRVTMENVINVLKGLS